ncbi:lysophospholipid acyltransferase [Tulasnella sp. JGI-2019a]|nr:lysophospholipid acyltransferase [Tulasnella sp. JGI-2019a]KAG9015774.1 lysophospholipid acyltransferase [Tulasnella sp. JGI-2019a]KAG9039593.1 lysophospholipid acyltransferase [Tulasnella sp. JGI-2019a]
MLLDSVFDAAGAAAGVHGSHMALLACFIISYPLGSGFLLIPKDKPVLKHAYNIGVSLFFLLGMLHLWTGLLHVLASSMITYILAATMKGRAMPWTVFAVVMSHLLLSHWNRYMWPTDAVEISGPQMVLIMKLSTFAWNVYDGQQKLESLDESQKETRIPAMPDLLSYFGYVFYFPAFLVGPSLTYADYMALINETAFEKFRTEDKQSRIPSGRRRVAFQKLIFGLAGIGFYAVYGGKFGYEVMLKEGWAQNPIWYRVAFTQLIGLTQRTKYYGAWMLTEGACIFSGYGFNGYDKKGRTLWNKAANVDIPNIEFAPNFKILLDSWNINTNTWLRNSVYKRLVKPGGKPNGMTTLYTFMTSAIWHGVYPGYYLTFFLGSLLSSAAKGARKCIRPFFLPADPAASKTAPPTTAKKLYDIAGTAVTIVILNYIVAPFMLLGFWDSITAWRSLYAYGHVVVFGFLLWGNVLGGFGYLNGMAKKRAMKASSKEAWAAKESMSPAKAPATPFGELEMPPLDQVVKDIPIVNGATANGSRKTNEYTNGKTH